MVTSRGSRSAGSISLWSVLVAAGALVLCLAGCTSGEPSPQKSVSNETPDAVVIVAGVHEGMPAADVPIELEDVLTRAVEAGAPLTVIANDGTPSVVFHIAGYEISDKNANVHENDVARILGGLLDAVTSATADSDGNNLSTSIAIATDQLAAAGAEKGAIIVIDNGISDAGYPVMAAPGMLDADQSDKVIALGREAGQALVLANGTTIYLVGFGYVAPPQEPLTTIQSNALSQTWAAYLRSTGAEVVEITKPRAGEGPDTTYTTTLVPPGEYDQIEVSRTATTVVASLASDMLFDSGSARLRDDERTRAALSDAESFLRKTPGAVTITGHTDAIGTPESNEALGRERATEIYDWLISRGVSAARLSVRSAGETELLVPDASTPDQHQKNRRVTISVLTESG